MIAIKDYKIMGFGTPIVDYVAYVPEEFVQNIDGEKGGMVLVDNETQSKLLASIDVEISGAPGGSAGNTIFGLAKLGVKSKLLGQLGGDEAGVYYRDSFVKLGGDPSAFFVDENNATGRCLSLVTPDSERTMRTCLSALTTLNIEKITEELFADISHVHIEGYMASADELFCKVLECAKKANCIVSLDLASFEVVEFKRELLTKALSEYVDIVFANEDEAEKFCGTANVDEQIAKLSENCDIAVLKLGKDGAMIKMDDEEIVKVDANLVEAVDTTGAGDYWQCGFLYGLLNGYDLEKCGKFGSVLGAEVVSVMGAELSSECWDLVQEKFRKIIAE